MLSTRPHLENLLLDLSVNPVLRVRRLLSALLTFEPNEMQEGQNAHRLYTEDIL